MKENHIQLLRRQIEKLDQKGFDLEAWKKSSIILLARIFGENNQKIKQIEKLEFEYNSWTLRDTTGFSSYLQNCKNIGREIMEACIDELEHTGVLVKDEKAANRINTGLILSALEDELKGSQFRALMEILRSEMIAEEKRRQVKEILKQLDTETIRSILESILLNQDFIISLNL